MNDFDRLIHAATEARAKAHAPYSRFLVGAAVQAADGRIFTGCNIENASYGLTICAERVALFNARSAGATALVAIAVVADTSPPTPPCGACRQVIVELAGDVPVVLANLEGALVRHSSRELLPAAFDGRFFTPPA